MNNSILSRQEVKQIARERFPDCLVTEHTPPIPHPKNKGCYKIEVERDGKKIWWGIQNPTGEKSVLDICDNLLNSIEYRTTGEWPEKTVRDKLHTK